MIFINIRPHTYFKRMFCCSLLVICICVCRHVCLCVCVCCKTDLSFERFLCRWPARSGFWVFRFNILRTFTTQKLAIVVITAAVIYLIVAKNLLICKERAWLMLVNHTTFSYTSETVHVMVRALLTKPIDWAMNLPVPFWIMLCFPYLSRTWNGVIM